MVVNIRIFFSRIARDISLALVRIMLGRPCIYSRRLYIEQLAELAFNAAQSDSFEAYIKAISIRDVTPEQSERLFRLSCAHLNTTTFPDSAIAAFEEASGGAIHYSQEGEDIALARMLGSRKNGFFVDVGAHHATRFSNTYSLYRKGWRGVNIDATPGSMESFNRIRPEDTNLEFAVSDRKEMLTFSIFKEGALNTFDSVLANSYVADGWELMGTVELAPRPLADIFEEYLPADQKIDLLSIDVEGEDLAVLRSNNWEKYCPYTIIIEVLDTPLTALHDHPTITFLADKGFVPVSRLTNSIILRWEQCTCAAS
jgi:FkbM family methyltransferase